MEGVDVTEIAHKDPLDETIMCLPYLQIIREKAFSFFSHFILFSSFKTEAALERVFIRNMNTIGVVGVLAFLIISPAICDEGNKNAKEIVTQNPQPYLNSMSNEFTNGNSWFERQLRAPSGFFGVRGKKDYDDDDWNVEVLKIEMK